MTNAAAKFFNELAERGHEPLLEKAEGTVRFELTDGKQVDRWLLAIDKGDLKVSHKNGRADSTIRCNKALFDAIANGEANATAAVLRGAMTIEGDIELIVSLQRVFRGPNGERPS